MQQGHRHRRSRRRRRRIRQLQLLVAACILVTGVVLVCAARHSNKQEAKEAAAAAAQTEAQEMKTVEPPAQNPEPEEEPEPERDWDEEARYMAQACFGEGWICQSKTEWAAIYWNILNRVDSDDPYYPDDIIGVVTQSAQYHGYSPPSHSVLNVLCFPSPPKKRYSGGSTRPTSVSPCFSRCHLSMTSSASSLSTGSTGFVGSYP